MFVLSSVSLPVTGMFRAANEVLLLTKSRLVLGPALLNVRC